MEATDDRGAAPKPSATSSLGEVSTIPANQLEPDQSYPWVSGWIGIEYGVPVHGFGELFLSLGRGAIVYFRWLAPDGGIYQSVEVKYVVSRARIDFYIGLQEDVPHEREQSALIPVAERRRMRELVGASSMYPQELFTRMVAPYASIFQILTRRYAEKDLVWDDRWHKGPELSYLWRPVDLGSGLAPFLIMDSSIFSPEGNQAQATDPSI